MGVWPSPAATRGFFWGDASFWRGAHEPARGLDGKGSSDPGHPSTQGVAMKKCLSLFDLLMLGVASVIGAGIFVITGLAAREQAGPAIVISYLISGVVCVICALCYAELATETTVTGGSILYTARTFGKLAAWMVAVNVVLEFILSVAAVAKGFSPYFCQLINQPPDAALLTVTGAGGQPLQIDLCAMGLVLLMMALLLWGVQEASAVNAVTTLVAVGAIIVTIVAGFVKTEPSNWTSQGFAPYGVQGIFTAASQVFFAYIGFEVVSTAAEEARNPARDVPIATVATVGLCGTFYLLMSLAITGMVPYLQIDASAPFSMAFRSVGWPWASYIVAVGALMAIVNTVLATQFALSRTFVTLARLDLLPAALARVHPKTQTPIVSTILCGLISATLATFVPLDTLADLVSVGTLVAFTVVCLGTLWRRLYQPGNGQALLLPLVPMVTLTAAAVALALSYALQAHYSAWIVSGGVWLLATLSLYFIPTVYTPSGYRVPLYPLWPSMGVLMCLLLIGTLGPDSWVRWAYAMVAGLVTYAAWHAVGALRARHSKRGRKGGRMSSDDGGEGEPRLGEQWDATASFTVGAAAPICK